jgi:hypothetical protein
MRVNEISADIVEAVWQETAGFSDARGRGEMERLGREQPELLAYVLGATEELSAPVHALGVYVLMVIWQIFRRSTDRRIPRIKAVAIERALERNEETLAKLEHADVKFLERAATVQASVQPHVFRYVVEAIVEAPDDADDPVEMTAHEGGTLFLVLKTAIDLLHEAREHPRRHQGLD